MKAFLLLIILGCASHHKEVPHPSGLVVQEIKPSRTTFLTKQNLLQLAQVYDLKPFTFTAKIQVKDRVVSHSHPVLTLNTKHAQVPKRILASFLHEEFHWYVLRKPKETNAAVSLLSKRYTNLSLKGKSRLSQLKHLIVSSLEYRALTHLLGGPEAEELTRLNIQEKTYPWIYQEVLEKRATIEEVLRRSRLMPENLL